MQAVESAATADQTSTAIKRPLIVFKSAGVASQPGGSGGDGNRSTISGTVATSNPEAINIDLPMNDDEDIDNVVLEDEANEDEEAKIIEDLDEEANSRKLMTLFPMHL